MVETNQEQGHKTLQKALEINLDDCKYGTIVEIGAGQEVARNFFRAGGAAGTIAKTMSAYDMQVSDSIYGAEESGRYVSRSRLNKMLEQEYQLVIDRLANARKKNTTFFAYAATVTAKSYLRKNECHGWVGIRLQLYPGAEPSDIILHVRMLDGDGESQQEALGVLGVNLIHSAFYSFNQPKKIIESLADDLEQDRIEVDLINFSGPYFEEVENRLMNLHLIRSWLTRAIMFSPDGEVQVPYELLYKKNILATRGTFKPVTKVNIDMIECGLKKFHDVEHVEESETLVLAELTMASLTSGDKVDDADFLARIDMLTALGYNVMISDYLRYFRLRAYFRQYTQKQIGIVLGIPNLDHIFTEDYYEGLEGGILEAFAKLFPDNTRLYIYPMRSAANSELVTVDNFKVTEKIHHLYQYLHKNDRMIGLDNVNEALLEIDTKQILTALKKGRGEWESKVPDVVADMVVNKKLLGFGRG